jgi:hypothetical protein
VQTLESCACLAQCAPQNERTSFAAPGMTGSNAKIAAQVPGRVTSACAATTPPKECPNTSGLVRRSCRTISETSLEGQSCVASALDLAPSDPPWPRMSIANTLNALRSSATCKTTWRCRRAAACHKCMPQMVYLQGGLSKATLNYLHDHYDMTRYAAASASSTSTRHLCAHTARARRTSSA